MLLHQLLVELQGLRTMNNFLIYKYSFMKLFYYRYVGTGLPMQSYPLYHGWAENCTKRKNQNWTGKFTKY